MDSTFNCYKKNSFFPVIFLLAWFHIESRSISSFPEIPAPAGSRSSPLLVMIHFPNPWTLEITSHQEKCSEKYNVDICWLNSAFSFILYLWVGFVIRIRIHGLKWIRIHITENNNALWTESRSGTLNRTKRESETLPVF